MIYIYNYSDLVIRNIRVEIPENEIGYSSDDFEYGDIIIDANDRRYIFKRVAYSLDWANTIISKIIKREECKEDIFIDTYDELSGFTLFDNGFITE